MYESTLEKKCRLWLKKEHKGRLVKWVSPGNDGVPDRIALIPDCAPLFLEFKQPGKPLKPLQARWKKWLVGNGFAYAQVSTFNSFGIVVQAMLLDQLVKKTAIRGMLFADSRRLP